jgi:hypothetical protein
VVTRRDSAARSRISAPSAPSRNSARIWSVALLLITLGAIPLFTACQRKASPAWEIDPGKKIGVLDPSEGETDLAAGYGASNVRHAQIALGEGETADGTVAFPDDSVRRIEILWQDTAQRRFPARAILRGSKSLWKLSRGVSLGTTLKQLEDLNGGPFTLAGFGWDYEGVVHSWAGGSLDTLLGGTKIYLAPSQEARSDSVYSHVLGDHEYSSSVQAMQRLNPEVYQIVVEFPPVGGAEGAPAATPERPGMSTIYEIREQDRGKTFTYPITTRFTLYLDESKHPQETLTIEPEGIIGSISNIPAVEPPLYAARFEAVRSGKAVIKVKGFSVTIRVVE